MERSKNFGFPAEANHSEISLGSLSEVPENVSYLSEEPNQSMSRATIGLLWNENIQHLRITNYQEPSYYDEYFMTTSYSTTMQEMQESQAKKLAQLVRDNLGQSQTASVVEVGCGDGSFLLHASKYFDQVLGIEPSKKFETAA